MIRIRNLVLDSLTGEECTVDAIDLYGHVYTEDKNYDDFKRTIQPEGIELSEDWLKRFGFQHIEYRSKWQHNKFIFQIEDDGQFFLLNSYTRIGQIKYVHQLQNLYHSLTGEELTLSE